MRNRKGTSQKPDPVGINRREAMKLAAAAAAFGAALGYGVSAKAESGAARSAVKIEKMLFKIYRKDILLSSVPLASNVAEEIMNGNKLLIKFYRNNNLLSGEQVFAWSWGE